MRAFETGTGRGRILGTAQIRFYASEGRYIDGFDVGWDGDSRLVPALPGLALPKDGSLRECSGA
jgi:hypothetical protein